MQGSLQLKLHSRNVVGAGLVLRPDFEASRPNLSLNLHLVYLQLFIPLVDHGLQKVIQSQV